jgi:nucleotide-binding universal stress UspA family protein
MRLILALDLDDHAEALVAMALPWARRFGATLDLVYVDEHAYNALLVQDAAIRTLYEREWARVRDGQQARLETLQASLPDDLRGRIHIRSGRAHEEIASAARDHDAVLIGTHGRRGLSHALLGSVAERVVRTSPVPVLVLRQPTDV